MELQQNPEQPRGFPFRRFFYSLLALLLIYGALAYLLNNLPPYPPGWNPLYPFPAEWSGLLAWFPWAGLLLSAVAAASAQRRPARFHPGVYLLAGVTAMLATPLLIDALRNGWRSPYATDWFVFLPLASGFALSAWGIGLHAGRPLRLEGRAEPAAPPARAFDWLTSLAAFGALTVTLAASMCVYLFFRPWLLPGPLWLAGLFLRLGAAMVVSSVGWQFLRKQLSGPGFALEAGFAQRWATLQRWAVVGGLWLVFMMLLISPFNHTLRAWLETPPRWLALLLLGLTVALTVRWYDITRRWLKLDIGGMKGVVNPSALRSEERLEGVIQGVTVVLERPFWEPSYSVRLRLLAPAPIRITPLTWDGPGMWQPRKGRASIRTGHDAFDRAVQARGGLSPGDVALLGVEARQAILEVQKELPYPAMLGEHGLEIHLPPREATADRIERLAGIFSRLVTALSRLEPAPLLLCESLLNDPVAAVREQRLSLLLQHYPLVERTREALRAALRDSSWPIRLEAAQALGSEGVEALCRMADEAPEPWPAVVIEVLGRCGTPAALPTVRAALQRPPTRLAALEAVRRLRDRASVPLLLELDRRQLNEEKRLSLIAALVELADARVNHVFVEMLEGAPKVALAAVNALSRHGTRTEVEPLRRLAGGVGEGALRAAALQAIDQIKGRLGPVGEGWLSVAEPTTAEGALSLSGAESAGALSIPESDLVGRLSAPESGLAGALSASEVGVVGGLSVPESDPPLDHPPMALRGSSGQSGSTPAK